MAKKPAMKQHHPLHHVPCECAQVYYLPAHHDARCIRHEVHPGHACNLSWAAGTGATQFHYNLAPHHAYIVKHTVMHQRCMLEIQQLPRTPVAPERLGETAARAGGLPTDTCSCPSLGQTIECPAGTVPDCTQDPMQCIPGEPTEKKRK